MRCWLMAYAGSSVAEKHVECLGPGIASLPECHSFAEKDTLWCGRQTPADTKPHCGVAYSACRPECGRLARGTLDHRAFRNTRIGTHNFGTPSLESVPYHRFLLRPSGFMTALPWGSPHVGISEVASCSQAGLAVGRWREEPLFQPF